MQVIITGPCDLWELRPHLGDHAAEIPPGMPGGPVRDLVLALIARGIRPTVVTLDPSIDREVVAQSDRLRLRVGPARRHGRARDAFRQEREYIAATVAEERPDVVHAHWTYEFALGALKSGIPTLVTVHDWAPSILRHLPHPYRVVRLAMQLEVFRRRPPLTTVSPHMQRRIEGITRSSVTLVPNGLRDEVFGGAHPDPDPLLVSVNQGWTGYKNVTSLLSAFREVRGAFPRARLALIGSEYGPGETAQRWATERDLDDAVEFVGALSNADAVEWIRRGTLLAHPSQEESFGVAVLEAMANHVPVVGGRRSGGVPWLLDGGLAGALCDVRDPDNLAATIVGLLCDPSTRRRLAQRAYDRADRNFRIGQVADLYLERYEALLR